MKNKALAVIDIQNDITRKLLKISTKPLIGQ